MSLEENEFVSFSASLDGKSVRITVLIKDLEIVTRDNTKSFEKEDVAKCKSIKFEDIY